MNRTLSIILAALVFGGLCFFCAGRHSRLIVDKLKGASQAAFADANFAWASVSFDGRDARITGVAPTEDDRDAAVDLVRGMDGVRNVTSGLTIGDFTRELRARRSGNLVTLTGKVPSEETRSVIVARAANLFSSDSLKDDLSILGGPDDATWTQMAVDGISLLPRLQQGEVQVVNRDVSLHGRVDRPAVRDSLRKFLANLLPEGYTSSTELTVPAAVRTLTADECEKELGNIVRSGRIAFASGSARLTPESSPVLEEAVNVAKRCNGARIEIAGYTDSWGDFDLNQQLSEERAKAVLEYLAGRGISRGSLVAVGYGERNPIASNRTWTGRSMNRRIQFTIIR